MASLARRVVAAFWDLLIHGIAGAVVGAIVFNAITLFRIVIRGAIADITWEFVAIVSVIGAVILGGYTTITRAVEILRNGIYKDYSTNPYPITDDTPNQEQ